MKNSLEIARVLVTEEGALEILLMLNDEGTKTENYLILNPESRSFLDKLRDLGLIEHNGNSIWITSDGQKIVEKIRRWNNNV